MRRLAVLSLHTSPLAQPGTGDGGGMNVYVRELSTALAHVGVECDVYTRAWSEDLPANVLVEPGLRLHHVPAGELGRIPKEQLPAVVDEFADNVLSLMTSGAGVDPAFHSETGFDAIHANYWLSGLAGHRLKHELDLPLVSTFHTLARVKAEASPEEMSSDEPHRRAEAEASIMACSEIVLASCSVEAQQLTELYEVDPVRVRVVEPGVDHAFFGPGDRLQARRALALPPDVPVLLFVGRIQPLKGADVALARWPRCTMCRTPGWWWWAGRVGPAARSTCRSSTTWPVRSEWPTGCISRTRSRTSCSPPTTGLPTSVSFRADRSPSVSLPWRQQPAGPRS